MMIKTTSMSALLLFGSALYSGETAASPNVMGVSGTLSHGSQVTITGSGFGNKTKSMPFLWDNFETGSANSHVAGHNGWVEYGGPSHKYTTTTSYSGSQSAHNRTDQLTSQDWFRAIGQKGLNSDVAYFSFYAKWRKYSGTYSGNTVMKWFRINTQPNFYSSVPSMWFTIFPNNNDWFISEANSGGGGGAGQQDLCGGDSSPCTQTTMPTDNGPWGRFEVYLKLSTPGVPDGTALSWWNYRQEYTGVNVVTRASGFSGQHLDSFIIPGMNDEQGGNVLFDYYVDDVYVDTTPARVEICNTPTWAARTHCEPQIPSAWTDSSVSVSANLTGFPNFSTVYVYVIDATRSANTTGFSKTVNTPPAGLSAPTNLLIRPSEE